MTFKNLNFTELKLEASGTNEPADSELDAEATTIQKFYRSYSTRRGLADCAVVADELWWLDLLLCHGRHGLGQGCCQYFGDRNQTRDQKAQKLALQYWLEALSPLCLEPEMNKSMESNGEAGVGPRIGWVREYPSELRFRALKQVRLSAQPQPKPTIRVSPRLSPKSSLESVECRCAKLHPCPAKVRRNTCVQRE
ncbi:hypothetical protein Pyn_20918 [Prunus yedoensis var. nudiflora]|uniref:Uncharacterized protein n=1 Tax=Prunus yedoensis var. nudiflora TaxID=2094558 RepID=A0A314YE81_PRUYE|nr:hypothetical protein Pyn_20918 [Prunus yedoensis var. nudiflora]